MFSPLYAIEKPNSSIGSGVGFFMIIPSSKTIPNIGDGNKKSRIDTMKIPDNI